MENQQICTSTFTGTERETTSNTGDIFVIASIAAFVAAPGAPAYCASKSAVQRWAEATWAEVLAAHPAPGRRDRGRAPANAG